MQNIEGNIKIENISKEEILKMLQATLKVDISTAKEFLKLCHKKRRDMRKKISEIEYLLIEKDNYEKALKYINILLNRIKNGGKNYEHK